MREDDTGKVLHQFCSRRQAAIRQRAKESMQREPKLEADAGKERQPDSASGRQPYQAVLVDTSRRQRWLRLHCPDSDRVRLLNYQHLVEAVTASPQRLSLIFTHGRVILQGRNLTALMEMLQEERIRALVSFHAKHHLPPEDKRMPYIEAMLHETGANGACMGG